MVIDDKNIKLAQRRIAAEHMREDRLRIFLAALPYNLARAVGLEANEDRRRTRAIEDAIRLADEALELLAQKEIVELAPGEYGQRKNKSP